MNTDPSTAVEIVQDLLARQETEPWRPVSERAEEIVAALDEAAYQRFHRERMGTWKTEEPMVAGGNIVFDGEAEEDYERLRHESGYRAPDDTPEARAAYQKFVRERTGTRLTPQPEHIIPRVPRPTLELMPGSGLIEDLPLVYEFYEGRGSFIRRRRSGL